MKKSILYILAALFSHLVQAQSIDFRAEEDSLLKLRTTCLLEESDSIKIQLNKQFTAYLLQVLAKNNSMLFGFDSLKSLAILVPEDKSFRIINWEIGFSDNSIAYFGLVQHFSKKKNQMQLTELIDKSSNVKKPENVVLDAANWYGAHYYKLIETKKKKKKYYTLLGANWSNTLVRKKIIDVITIGNDGKVKFGDAIFQHKTGTFKRIILNYASEISVSLRYDESKKMILFDHLVPREPNLKGQFEFYGPDMSIDGYSFQKGKWLFKEDIDARNQKK